MEDNYLDKKIKDILESPPEMKVDAVAIAGLKKRLKAIQPPARNNRLFYWLLPLLLPLFFGLGYFFHHYRVLSQKSQSFDELTSKILLIDTIVEKHITYHYDTIYNTVYHQTIRQSPEKAYSIPSILAVAPPTHSLLPLNSRKGALYTNYLFPSPFATAIADNKSDTNDKAQRLNTESATPLWPINALHSLSPALFPFDKRTDPDFIQKVKEELPEGVLNKKSPLYYFVPDNISAGLNTSPLITPDHDFGGTSYSYGLNGIVEFAGGRSLAIGASLLDMNFEIKDPNSNIAFPVSAPTDPSDVLHELKVYLTYLQIPLVVRQSFRNEKKLQPMISAGVVTYRPLRQRFIYEYINGTSEYKLRNSFNDGRFSVNNFRFGIGANYELGQRLSINAETFIQRGTSLNEEEYFKLNYWALQLGLNYNFKK